MRMQDDTGLSEVLDTTLIVALALVLAGITAAFVFGVFVPVDKTAYLVPKFTLVNESGQTMISVYNRGGEAVSFTNGSSAKYRADLYMDTQSGSFRAHPVPELGVFEPGDMIYVYYSGSGFVVTKSVTGLTFPPLPAGRLMITLVDATSGVVMAQEVLIPGTNLTTIPTTTQTVNITTTSTTAVTTTAPTVNITTTSTTAITTTAPTVNITTTSSTIVTTTPITVVTTTPPATHVITVSWSPWGLGSVSPPGGNTGASVSVPVIHGASQTFVATPAGKKAVLSVTVDGFTIYSGSSPGTPYSFTFNNVVSGHTLAVRFG